MRPIGGKTLRLGCAGIAMTGMLAVGASPALAATPGATGSAAVHTAAGVPAASWEYIGFYDSVFGCELAGWAGYHSGKWSAFVCYGIFFNPLVGLYYLYVYR